jgi:hypothetical protein
VIPLPEVRQYFVGDCAGGVSQVVNVDPFTKQGCLSANGASSKGKSANV